jgi:hypothetical protein
MSGAPLGSQVWRAAAAGGSIQSSQCASDDDGDLGHVELVAF